MFAHHFLTLPDNIINQIDIPYISVIAPYLSAPFKICVSVFAFITGYFYYFVRDKGIKHSLRKSTDILIFYWIALLFLVLLTCVLTEYRYSAIDLIKEATSLSLHTVCFGWYIPFYCVMMFLLLFLSHYLGKNCVLDLLVTLFCIPICCKALCKIITFPVLVDLLEDVSLWAPCMLIGYLFATYDCFFRLEQVSNGLIKNCILRNACSIFVICICLAGRFVFPGMLIQLKGLFDISFVANADVIYAPMFVFSSISIIRTGKYRFKHVIDKCLSSIGRYSEMMWFLHCAFFNECKTVLQPLVYYLRNPVFIVLFGVSICYILAKPMNCFATKLATLKNRLLFRDCDDKSSSTSNHL